MWSVISSLQYGKWSSKKKSIPNSLSSSLFTKKCLSPQEYFLVYMHKLKFARPHHYKQNLKKMKQRKTMFFKNKYMYLHINLIWKWNFKTVIPGKIWWNRSGNKGCHGLAMNLLKHHEDLWALRYQLTFTTRS